LKFIIIFAAVWKTRTCEFNRSIGESLGEVDLILKCHREAAGLSRGMIIARVSGFFFFFWFFFSPGAGVRTQGLALPR